MPLFLVLAAVLHTWALYGAGACAFLSIKDIEGESSDAQHRNWIEVKGFSLMASGSASSGSSGAGKGQFGDMTIAKTLDKASPKLLQSCAEAKTFATATLELIRGDAPRSRYYQLVLNNVSIRRVGQALPASSGQFVETNTLQFGKIQWTYTQIDSSGKASQEQSASWDAMKPKLAELGTEATLADMAETSTQSTGATQATFRVLASPLKSGEMRLTWTSTPKVTYHVLAADEVDGPYEFYLSVDSAGSGTTSLTIPAAKAHQFFIVIRQ